MKKLVALVLAAILALSSACALAEDKIVVRIMREAQNIWFPEGEDLDHNALIEYVEDKLGIDFVTEWTADSGAYAQQINMKIASDDLPDMFYATTAQMSRLYEYGMIQPIGQYFEEYLSEDALKRLNYGNGSFLAGCTFDGEIYGFPCPDDFRGDMPFLFVRQDWLDNLGLSYDINNFTLDDLLEMCEAFTNGDPDGDGENNTYAMEFDALSSSGITGFGLAHALGLQTNIWVENTEGKLEYTDIREENKAYLKLLQTLYQKGYIPSEYISMSYWSQGTTELAKSKCGIFTGYFWSGLGAPEIACQTDPNIKFTVFPIPRNPDGEYRLQSGIKNSKFLVVNANYEHPEAAVRYMALWQDMWSGNGEDAEFYHSLNGNEYAKAEEDFKYYVPFFWGGVFSNQEISDAIVAAIELGSDEVIKNDHHAYKEYQHVMNYLNHVVDEKGEIDWYGFAQYYNFCESGVISHKLYGGVDGEYVIDLTSAIALPEELASIKSLLNDLRYEYYNKIIMGADLDATFAEYVSQWHAIGGDQVAAYYNEWYAVNGAKFK